MTQLHAGGKFDQNSYKVSGGLHGVGVSVVNALSAWLSCGSAATAGMFMRFHARRAGSAAAEVAPSDRDAAPRSRFLPSTATFTKIEFDFTTLEHRLRELAFLNCGVRIVLTDQRDAEPKARGRFITTAGSMPSCAISTARRGRCIQPPIAIRGERDGIIVEVAMWWNDSYHETMLCFTNNIPQRDGGTHLAGFRGALTRTSRATPMTRHRQEGEGRADRRGHARRADLRPVGEGARPEILLADQGQAGLLRGAAGGRGPRRERLQHWFEEHPKEAKQDRRQGRRGRARRARRRARRAS